MADVYGGTRLARRDCQRFPLRQADGNVKNRFVCLTGGSDHLQFDPEYPLESRSFDGELPTPVTLLQYVFAWDLEIGSNELLTSVPVQLEFGRQNSPQLVMFPKHDGVREADSEEVALSDIEVESHDDLVMMGCTWAAGV